MPWNFVSPSWFCFSSLANLSFSMATPFWLSNCAILAIFDLTRPCFAPVYPPLKTRDKSHCLVVELEAFDNYLCNYLCFRSLFKPCLMHCLVMWPYWWFECMEHAMFEALGTRAKSVTTSWSKWHLLTRFAKKWTWNLQIHHHNVNRLWLLCPPF